MPTPEAAPAATTTGQPQTRYPKRRKTTSAPSPCAAPEKSASIDHWLASKNETEAAINSPKSAAPRRLMIRPASGPAITQVPASSRYCSGSTSAKSGVSAPQSTFHPAKSAPQLIPITESATRSIRLHRVFICSSLLLLRLIAQVWPFADQQ